MFTAMGTYGNISTTGLDFTNIKDSHGSAIYLIHDGSEKDEKNFNELALDIGRRSKKQIVVLSADDKNAQEVIRFYQLRGSHFVLVVRDDDQLHHVWSDGERFDASQIAYVAEQAG